MRAATCGLILSSSIVVLAKKSYPLPSRRLKPVGLPATKAPISERVLFGLVREKHFVLHQVIDPLKCVLAGHGRLNRQPLVEHQRGQN